MERWFVFRAYNSQPVYGYGTSVEAGRYNDELNRNRQVNLYAPYVMSLEQVSELNLNDDYNDLGIALSVALSDIDEYKR